MKSLRLSMLTLASGLALAGLAHAGEVRVMCYQDGNECEVTAELAKPDSPVNPVVRNELAKRPAPKSFDDVARLYSDIFVTCMTGNEPDNAAMRPRADRRSRVDR